MELRLPTFALSSLTLNDFIVGTIFLALPQVPLTLGNHAYALHSVGMAAAGVLGRNGAMHASAISAPFLRPPPGRKGCRSSSLVECGPR
jgi:hypothetical protein